MTDIGYSSFKEGVKACIPTVLGYVGIGLAAGVISKSIGLTLLEIILMSVFIYAGSAQFIICGMIALHSPVSAIVFTIFLVNLRHFLMSMSVAPDFKEAPLFSSIAVGSLLTDESYGVLVTALNQGKKVSLQWTHGLNLTAYFVWISATVLGGLLGDWLPEPESLGLDFALLAMFIGLFVLQVDLPIKKQAKKTVSVLLSVCLSLYLSMGYFSPEISVIIATILGCVVGMVVPDHE